MTGAVSEALHNFHMLVPRFQRLLVILNKIGNRFGREESVPDFPGLSDLHPKSPASESSPEEHKFGAHRKLIGHHRCALRRAKEYQQCFSSLY
jgi:hypothetical protein